jgi:hypothetical protein
MPTLEAWENDKSLSEANYPADVKNPSGAQDDRGRCFTVFRFGTDRKVRVRALSQNHPKRFENVKRYYAGFQGHSMLPLKNKS